MGLPSPEFWIKHGKNDRTNMESNLRVKKNWKEITVNHVPDSLNGLSDHMLSSQAILCYPDLEKLLYHRSIMYQAPIATIRGFLLSFFDE
jgi:hypothetical protein